MKKLMFIALALVAIVLTNCKKDDTTAPSVSFGNADSTVVTKDAGAEAFSVTVTGTATDDEELKSVVCMKGGTQVGKISEFTDKKSYPFSFVIADIPATAGVIVITVTATDANDNTDSKDFRIIVKINTPAGNPIYKYTGKVLGSNSNTNDGSYFATSTGAIFKSGSKNDPSIDIIYGFATVDKFYSPSIDATITGGNVTHYATSAIDFASVTNDDLLLQNITATATEISGFAVNDVIQFVTESGKKGIFKVTDYTPGISGSVTIDVKVQE
jgi:hypothetical protein